MRLNSKITAPALAATIFVVSVLAGCGSSDDPNKLVVYSGRAAELIAPLYDKFERETGVDLEVRYGGSPELAATLQEEGSNSPADVFYAQDAGAIGSVSAEGLLAPLPANLTKKIDDRYRDKEGRWTGVTGRVRAAIYNTDNVEESELPDSVLGFADPKWKDRIGIAPGNASFESFVTAMRLAIGDDATREWLEALKANNVKTYEKNSQIAEAVARGEIDAGLVNHYYLYELLSEQPNAPAANHFFKDGDPGNLVNVSAAGIVASSNMKPEAEQFMQFLLDEGQVYFAEEADEREYPVVDGFKQPEGVPPLAEVQGPDVDLSTFGAELPDSVQMIESVGFSGT